MILPHCIQQFLITSWLKLYLKLCLVFKSKIRNRTGFSKTSVYWASIGRGRRYFTRQTVIDAISFLIAKCHFTIENLVFKQEIGTPTGIDLAPCWANLLLYFFESICVQQLRSKGSPCAYKFHRRSRKVHRWPLHSQKLSPRGVL